MFRTILQQQRKLQDLEIELQALEKETEVWERERSSATVLTLVTEEELEDLEQRLRQNAAILMHRKQWQEQLQAEMDREQGTCQNLFRFSTFVESNFFL